MQSNPSLTTLDLDTIQSLNELQPDLLPELIQLLFTLNESELDKMEAAIAVQDWKLIGDTAHSLKSSNANLGAMKFSDLCKQLEYLCRKGNPTDQQTSAIIKACRSEYQTLKPLLLAQLKRAA